MTQVDWSKVDAALAGALAEMAHSGEHLLTVFIEMDAGRADESVLGRLGVDRAAATTVCTATLSTADLDQLTELPWVTRLRLSRPLRLLGDR